VGCEELLHCGEVAEGRPLIEIVSVSKFSVEEAGGKVLIEGEELFSKFIENRFNAIGTIAIRIDLGEELTTQQSDSVDKLKVAILSSNVVLVIFFFLS
jgi:hypothetical protein